MVYSTVTTPPLQQEAIRAMFRQYELEASLTPELEALVIGLSLIDIKNSSVRCQGQCANGGRCSQRINQSAVSRSILQLQIAALDSNIVGEELEEDLGRVYAALLCGSARHNTPEQIARCAAKATAVVEVWRVQFARGTIEKQKYGGECTGCIRLFQGLQGAEAEVEEVAAQRDHAFSQVESVRARCKRLRQQRDDAEEREEDLAKQLESLQIKHDGLVRKMGSTVEKHQQSSNPSTPEKGGSWSSIIPASLSNMVSEAAGRVAERNRLAYENVEAMRRKAPMGEPITPPATSSSAGSKTRPTTSQRRKDTADTLTSNLSEKLDTKTRAKETSTDELMAPFTRKAKPSSTSKPDSPFAHYVPTNSHGMLGIGNTTRAGPRPPTGVFKLEPTPEKKHGAGDVLFKSGPLQSPRFQAQREVRQAAHLEQCRKEKRESEARSTPGGGYFAPKPWNCSEVKGEKEKEKAPYGFAVRRKE